MTTPQSLIARLASPDSTGRTEADIQSDIKTLLTTDDFDLDTPRLEEQIGDGSYRRIDIVTGATVIEVKKRLTNESADADYINQLADYVTTRMSQDGSRYNEILTDGKTWWLFEQSPPPRAPSPGAAPSSLPLELPGSGLLNGSKPCWLLGAIRECHCD